MQAISLEGSYNARGIGREEAPWIVRSAAIDAATERDEQVLRAHGVDLVLDLREPAEQGARSHGIPVRSLSLYGETPPAAGSLEAVYAGLVAHRGERLAAAVATIAEHPGTVLVHCTAGKDRTGLVVALARLAAGDDRAAVIADYARSGDTVRAARATLVAGLLDRLGLVGAERRASERLHLDSPAVALATALEQVDALGGVESYLLDRGATPQHLAVLAARAARSAPAPAPAARALALAGEAGA